MPYDSDLVFSAAFLAGVQPPAFSLSEVVSLAETGVDYWADKIMMWQADPEAFMKELAEQMGNK